MGLTNSRYHICQVNGSNFNHLLTFWEVLSKPELYSDSVAHAFAHRCLYAKKTLFFIEHICLGDDAKYFCTQPRATVLWLNLSIFHTQLLPGDTRLYFDICYKKKLFHDIIPCINGDDTHENTLYLSVYVMSIATRNEHRRIKKKQPTHTGVNSNCYLKWWKSNANKMWH